MQHPVAIGADRAEVLDRIDQVLFAVICDLLQVVDLDESFTNTAIGFAEIESAYGAVIAMVFDARFPCAWATVVSFGRNGFRPALCIFADCLRG